MISLILGIQKYKICDTGRVKIAIISLTVPYYLMVQSVFHGFPRGEFHESFARPRRVSVGIGYFSGRPEVVFQVLQKLEISEV